MKEGDWNFGSGLGAFWEGETSLEGGLAYLFKGMHRFVGISWGIRGGLLGLFRLARSSINSTAFRLEFGKEHPSITPTPPSVSSTSPLYALSSLYLTLRRHEIHCLHHSCLPRYRSERPLQAALP